MIYKKSNVFRQACLTGDSTIQPTLVKTSNQKSHITHAVLESPFQDQIITKIVPKKPKMHEKPKMHGKITHINSFLMTIWFYLQWFLEPQQQYAAAAAAVDFSHTHTYATLPPSVCFAMFVVLPLLSLCLAFAGNVSAADEDAICTLGEAGPLLEALLVQKAKEAKPDFAMKLGKTKKATLENEQSSNSSQFLV